MSYLVIDKLSKRYGQTLALSDFSLTVARGELVALVGPDGAGKTSCIRILCQLLSPDSGDATLGDINLITDRGRINRLVGYMPQQFSLYSDLSVEENLTFYGGIHGLTGAAYRKKRDYLYSFSNLAPFAKRRAGALSGGMKQKLALSCALMHDPEMLILDEPTTGVDPLSRRQFWEILFDLKRQGVTILVTTPYMDEVARCDRACFLFGGRKLTEGNPQELASQFDGKVYALPRYPELKLVDQINQIPGLTARRFGAGLHVYAEHATELTRVADPLAQLGIRSDELSPVRASLEDRFIQLMEQAE